MEPESTAAMAQGIDFLEDTVYQLDRDLLDLLLTDKTTGKHILWATTDYEALGAGYGEFDEITPESITGPHSRLIQPRIAKTMHKQTDRTRVRAEVFTPCWVCNMQNNLVDDAWFGRTGVFNTPQGTDWTVNPGPVRFEDPERDWKAYVTTCRLEITCGEAPYLVSRYDTVTGQIILLHRRIGLLDRKLRIVNENTKTAADWLNWTRQAFESIYGYEYQGDNLLLARENLLYSYTEYYQDRFGREPDLQQLKEIAEIIVFNIWQMDGLKGVVPGSCERRQPEEPALNLFADPEEQRQAVKCPGCKAGGVKNHIGQYCRIKDWQTGRELPYASLLREGIYFE